MCITIFDLSWVVSVVSEVMRSQGNLAFTYGGRGGDQIHYGSTVEEGALKLVSKFIHTLCQFFWEVVLHLFSVKTI